APARLRRCRARRRREPAPCACCARWAARGAGSPASRACKARPAPSSAERQRTPARTATGSACTLRSERRARVVVVGDRGPTAARDQLGEGMRRHPGERDATAAANVDQAGLAHAHRYLDLLRELLDAQARYLRLPNFDREG